MITGNTHASSMGAPSTPEAIVTTGKDVDNDSSSEEPDFKKEAAAMEWEGDHNDFPMRTFQINNEDGYPIFLLNPVVSFIGIAVLWGLSIWCMVAPEKSYEILIEGRTRLSAMFTFFYVGTNPAFMFFLIYIAFRFGNIRLGPQDSTPEFSDFAYFAMLFSAGIGVGLFFFGVSEPLWHQSSHWFAQAGYHSQDEIDMFALNLTVFHWGFTGWSQYLVVAICAGLASFRFKLPMTLRSCFYPILGEHTWGWMGDVIDGFSIVATVSGVCTSLGLGAFQLAAGLERVGAIDDATSTRIHVISIWIITLIATGSVVSGLDVGIKLLSQLGFGLGMVLLWLCLVFDKTNYLLNLMIQETGYYLQWSILQLNFHTDAFGQLQTGEGRAVDGDAAEAWWMDAWTIFYVGWWVSWAAFVGMFVARISKGRTIGSICLFSYAIPLAYTILWFSVFGGIGLRQSRQAQEMKALGMAVGGSEDYYVNADIDYCYDVPQEAVSVNGSVVFENTLMGVTPVCEFNSAQSDMAWFNVLYSYSFPNDFTYGFGPFLSWLSLVALTIYFVTSSDSGSLIVDHLASNGFPDTHWTQRVFWAFTEGALATALLVSGGPDGLRALQAASILTGLPFNFFLVFMCVTSYKMLVLAEQNNRDESDITLKEAYRKHKTFQMPVFGGVFNIFEYVFSMGMAIPEARQKVMPFPNGTVTKNFFVALLVPFVPYHQLLSFVYPKPRSKTSNMILTGIYATFHLLWISLFISMTVSRGFQAIAWTAFVLNGCILTHLRSSIRERYRIEGNLFHDLLMSTFVWPQVLSQLSVELSMCDGENHHLDNDDDDDDDEDHDNKNKTNRNIDNEDDDNKR
ncbi:BCCT family transporter-domain containing protein [Nitzschia inconspicua]|uniref:BCCT family transporter-domain containing protein n=1 Tax=Nitzschia inconspicua TaxID=303405 RepID=A0A9K3PPF0_9STRA|nr:BCCT family transporter-domain containing protein [Nitzschia inconspicua]